MLKWLTNLFKTKYPPLKKVWYNFRVHDKETSHLTPFVFDENKNYIDCVDGLVCKMGVDENGNNIFYKVTKHWRERPWSDWLYASDSVNCEMKFSHIEKV